MRYRPDIDGLRAFAILPVIAYHTGQVGGGYVGVDVFFVISGFLIGTTMIAEMSEGRFSLLNFYERRIRRLGPALLAMLLFTYAVGYFVLLPSEFVALGKSAVSAIASLSNVYFWQSSSYFGAPAKSTPLLHTWSLAVEEQFYITLPILIYGCRKLLSGRLFLLLSLAAAVSLLLSAAGVYLFRDFTFYLLPTRAWELLLGVLIGFERVPKPSGRWSQTCMGAGGLVLILASVFLYKPGTNFPGLTAIPPCLGAAMVIMAGERAMYPVGAFLSFYPIRFIGLISYSLYLWHWPIIVFQEMGAFMTWPWLGTGRVWALVITATSIAVATLSWRFIEQPFRVKSGRFKQMTIYGLAGAGAAVLAGIGITMVSTQGMPARFTPDVIAIGSYIDYDATTEFRDGTCFISSNYKFANFRPDICLHADPSRPNVLVVGDSQAADLWYGLSNTYPTLNVMQVTASGCRATYHFKETPEKRCRDAFHFLYDVYLPTHPRISLLILSGRWTSGDMPELPGTLDRLKQLGVPVLLLGPAMQYDAPLPRLLAMAVLHQNVDSVDKHQLPELRPVDREMAAIAKSKNVPYVSIINLMCNIDGCIKFALPGVPIQFDYGHFTRPGSMLIAERLRVTQVMSVTTPVLAATQ